MFRCQRETKDMIIVCSRFEVYKGGIYTDVVHLIVNPLVTVQDFTSIARILYTSHGLCRD